MGGVAYQKILAVFATAVGGMRAQDVCLALGLSATAKDTEGTRAKLKRLVARQILVEASRIEKSRVSAIEAPVTERHA